jgi:hypothetical protein
MTLRTQALPSPSPRLDAQLRASLVAVALCGSALAIAALPFFGLSAALSVAVGAGLATANLWALACIVTALLPDETRASSGGARSAVAWAVLGMLKMFALFAVVWLLMRHGVVSVLPMLVGFGALPIGIAIGSLVRHRGAPPHDPRRHV